MLDLASLRQTFSQAVITESRALREESRKDWKCYVPNVSVYAVKGFGNVLSGEPSNAMRYEVGAIWFELMLTVLFEGAPRHYLAVIDTASISRREAETVRYAQADGDVCFDKKLVGVLIPEFIQLPERIGLVSIPSLIRLKAVDELDGVYWHPFRHLFESSWIAAAHHGKSRKVIRFAPEPRQLPREMTKAGMQVVDDLPSQNLELVPETRGGVECPFNQIPIRIFIADQFVRVEIDNVAELSLEFAQIVTRPDEFHPWPIEWVGWLPGRQGNVGRSHEVNSNHERQEDAEDPEGLRDSDTKARRLRRHSGQGSEAREALNSEAPPVQVAPQSASRAQGAGYTAKRTHSGSLEDA